jgi:hypothetical protein
MIRTVLPLGLGLALLSGVALADTKTDLAVCKMESLHIPEPLSLQYVRDCMVAKHYEFTPMPAGCVVPGQAMGTTGGYADKRLAVEQTTYDCFRVRAD